MGRYVRLLALVNPPAGKPPENEKTTWITFVIEKPCRHRICTPPRVQEHDTTDKKHAPEGVAAPSWSHVMGNKAVF